MPSETVPTRPCQPCLALARPHLASRALPRSASPTSPNQQHQASASTLDHALPARTGLARPCLRSHACRARPVQISPSPSKPCLPIHALPAWPFRPDRAMPAAPILASTGHAFRTMPANPCHSARCLASRANSWQPRGHQYSHRQQHRCAEPPGREEPHETHGPRCHKQQQDHGGTDGGGVIHQGSC